MRLDTANRSLLGLVAASLASAVWLLCGAAGCVLLSLIGYRVARDGPDALVGDDTLVPAAVFVALVAVGAVLGLRSLGRQVASSRRLARRVDELELSRPVALDEAAARTGLSGRLVMVDSDEPFSFVFGALTPRVAVSRGLYERTSPPEFAAVLEHERYHVHNLDPLKVLLARSLPATFYYLPILRDLHLRYMAGRELAADRRAVRASGPGPLAGALLKVVGGPGWPELSTAAAIGGPELLDLRIAQLEHGHEPKLGIVTAPRLLISLLGLAAVGASFVTAIALAGGPSAVADEARMSVDPVDILLGLGCALPLAAVGCALCSWLSRRTHRPPDVKSDRPPDVRSA